MKTIICINRQFGSGGHEVGEILSKKFGIPFYDSAIITECVKKTGIKEELIQSNDEKARASLLYSIAMGYFGNHYIEAPGDTVFKAQADVIQGFAQNGPCVIIGRCAGEILRDDPNARRIFIYADTDFRKKRIVSQYGYEPKKAGQILQQKDRERAAYHTRYADDRWDSINSFDLAISTSQCGIDGAVNTISAYIEQCENN